MTRLLAAGLALTAAVTALMALVWGRAALVPGVVFGLGATAIQLAAYALVRPVAGHGFNRLMARWAMGMGLRLLGVALFAAVVLWDRELFPPLPTAFGYLGVLLPLLVMETRLLR